ncbi:MAG: hypothetical protein ACYCWW_15115 [Deltaproteobacteria bacterium]
MANSTHGGTSSGLYARFLSMLQGLQTAIPAGATMRVNGQSVTQAQLVALVLAAILPIETERNAKSSWQKAMAANAAALPGAKELYQQLKAALISDLGRKNPELTQFGIAPHTRKALTPEEKQLQAAKAKVTRQKRHTMGKVQKAKIKADGIPTVLVGPAGTQVIPAPIDLAPPSGNGASSQQGSSSTPSGSSGGSTGTGN